MDSQDNQDRYVVIVSRDELDAILYACQYEVHRHMSEGVAAPHLPALQSVTRRMEYIRGSLARPYRLQAEACTGQSEQQPTPE